MHINLIMITYTRKKHLLIMQEVHAMDFTFSDALIIGSVIAIGHYCSLSAIIFSIGIGYF